MSTKHYSCIQAALDSGDYDCYGALACSVLNGHIKDGKVTVGDKHAVAIPTAYDVQKKDNDHPII